jgi:NAD(P)-dependent dehydrogenase (short-subunit alcohol dehydrogenase family)
VTCTTKTIGADRATAVVGDISKPEDLDRLYEAVRARGKGVDVLVANAAVGAFVTLEQTTEEHFDQTFAVNVRGTLFTVQKALPLLNDGASIVRVGSTAGDRGVEAFGAYAASKAAVRSFARTWSNELKDRGIRVNVVSPAWIETPGGTAVSATRRPPGPPRRMSPRPAVPARPHVRFASRGHPVGWGERGQSAAEVEDGFGRSGVGGGAEGGDGAGSGPDDQAGPAVERGVGRGEERGAGGHGGGAGGGAFEDPPDQRPEQPQRGRDDFG